MDMQSILLYLLVTLCLVNLALQLIMTIRRRRSRGEDEAKEGLVNSTINDLRNALDSRFDSMDLKNGQFREAQLASLEGIRRDNARQMESMLQRSDRLSETLERNMQALRKENGEQLERMRKTVDDQLKDTLETRLSRSFEQVQKQLESVYKGLGEMQNLAKSVGDLSRIFSNVKTRGMWGEIQVESILDDILSKDQYVRNFKPRPRSQEVVEFANSYLKAQEAGDMEGVRLAQNAMRTRVLSEARDISEKYIAPPRTTDFAILFLPSESIYAEILSMAGFAEELQNRYRVTIAGPTTLAALVNSLQMGFRTLAVEKRSHEVWKLFSQMKKQFSLFAASLDAAGRSLGTAVNRIEDVSTRSARISRKLDSIELPEQDENAEEDRNLLE